MELAWSLGSQVRGVSARNGAYLNVAPNQDQAGINQGQFDDRGYIKKVVWDVCNQDYDSVDEKTWQVDSM